FAMKTLDAGVAYSIWVSFGSIGALVVGSLVYGEKLNTKQMICVALIIVAVIGLKIF
ncbi:MAG TPA: QacE family quaternary ammonium compound efflux SMR transporter, partial [Lactobacillus sp.]|nr:QacE family quaternary ammonium compound efflux SMR transporter [Lactobacillus sp.]